MNTNNVLVPEQFSFGEGLSTKNAAFELINNMLKSINQKMHVGLVFCAIAITLTV
jgi:hypothetical protein